MRNEKELLAYMAGILDGEGSIMIKKSTYRLRSPKYGDCKNPQYIGRVSLKNTCEEVVKLFKEMFGGRYYKNKKIYYSRNGYRPNKIMHEYDAQHRIAYEICRKLYPFLRIKEQQAKKVLELEELKRQARQERDKNSPGVGGKPYKKEFIEKFEKLYQEVRTLNR